MPPYLFIKMCKLRRYFTLIVSTLVLTACGEKSKDDKMEDLALPLYKQMVSEKQYCKALEVTKKRFDYIVDHQTSNEELRKRFGVWAVRARSVESGCRKELWPAIAARIQAQIEQKTAEYTKYQEMIKVTAFVPTASFGKDAVDRECMYDVVIQNGSPYRIASFNFIAQKPFETHDEGRYPAFDENSKRQEAKTIAAGEERRIRMCNFGFGGPFSSLRTAQVDTIPLVVTKIVLEPAGEMDLNRFRQKAKGFDFENDITELKRRLVKENPNLPQ